MAKVNAPLFSFGASGKLANSLVFMKWKGIPDVRQWLVPANPKTAGQVTQRGVMTDAVDEWHNVLLTAGDKSAWNSLAAIAAKPLSGFNQFVKYYINIINAGDLWKLLYAGSAAAGAAGVIAVEVDSPDEVTVVKAWYGLKKTLMLTSVDMAFAAGVWSANITGLTTGEKYYIQFSQIAAGIEGISGIYESLAG